MKIGIVTIGDYQNYGNRLQNFALERAISKVGTHEVSTILSWRNFQPVYRITGFRSLKKFLTIVLPNLGLFRARMKRMREFSQENMHEYKPDGVKTRRTVDDAPFDKIVLGSDQVWNFTWQSLKDSDFYLLKGVPIEKKVGYAISMGNPPVARPFFASFIESAQTFSALSVREESAQRYLTSLSVSSQLVLDPTMLLSRDEWVSALQLKTSNSFQGDYILTYFLSKESEEVKAFIHEYSVKYHCQVINLLDLGPNGKPYYASDPSEFVKYIQDAKLVLTDSFHASVFSIVFHTPFLVAISQRGAKMSSRIDTLLSAVKLKENYFKPDNHNFQRISETQFTQVDQQLELLRKDSLSFLKKSLEP